MGQERLLQQIQTCSVLRPSWLLLNQSRLFSQLAIDLERLLGATHNRSDSLEDIVDAQVV
jgi:hypothetical protein